jgi:DNA replication protein DnaC
MKKTNATDAARIELLLAELRLPAMKPMWADLAARADKEGWPASRFLAALAEHEIADRGRRRIERHLAGAKLPTGKTFDTFDFNAVPMVSKAQVMALAAGDGWLDQGANILLFGPPGGGKSHLAAALVWLSFRTAGVCCSCAPPTSSSGCRWRAGSWGSKPPSPSSTSTNC